MRLIAIDPGPEESAYVLYDTDQALPLTWGKIPNERLLGVLDATTGDRLAIEKIASYGMAVGETTFETCVWTGRFMERWLTKAVISFPDVYKRPEPIRITRLQVKSHVCHSGQAKDANVRQALIDRYGGKEKAIGKKAAPGPLHGYAGDGWAALGVAVTVADTVLAA